MNLKIYREYGALNSVPVFDAFEKGAAACNFNIVNNNEDIAVIWSVLWQGKMAKNQLIYNQARAAGKPIIIIEVGNLLRGKTWRISANNINSNGIFNTDNLDIDRANKLNVKLQPIQTNRKSEILIALQHRHSLQWEGQPSIEDWVSTTIRSIKAVSDRQIIVRPHPRCPIGKLIVGAQIEIPKKIPGTYDSFNINYNYHCVVNHNSGPAVQAVISGIPVICDHSSLAAELSGSILNIENISLPDREEWFLKLCHTEWTVEEIATGLPLRRLLEKIS
jgi:hypothetical protein